MQIMTLFAAAALAGAVPVSAQPAESWRDWARQDVAAAYDMYAANHPGMHDTGNPGFPAQLREARDAGMALADKASDRAGYQDALGAFSAVLSDGHAQVAAKSENGDAPISYDWPGFVAAWRGKAMLVHHAGAGFPVPAGSRIVGCDGTPIKDLVKRNLLSMNFRFREAGQWWSKAGRVFVPPSGAARLHPAECAFRLADGAERKVTLSWSPVPSDMDVMLRAASDGERTPIGLSEPRSGLFLVGLPDFAPDKDGVEAYGRLFETLRARHADLAHARAIVLDLRHNNGGSSHWSQEAAKALWGDATVDAAMDNYFRNVSILWRASEANTAYVGELEPLVRGQGDAETADMIHGIHDGMAKALAAGQPFYDEDEKKDRTEKPVPPTTFTTPVYVITPGRCASACLDAVDVFTRFPNVTLIGAPTSADSTYLEVRRTDLPSGHGIIVIPNKVWVGRPRAAGEVYRPAIEMDGIDWSTAAFLDRIEGDLAAKGGPGPVSAATAG